MEEQTISRIKRYLNKKINPKVIALELGVSLEVVNKCQQDLIEEARKQQEAAAKQIQALQSNHKPSGIPTSYLKMKVLREKYEKAYFSDKEKATTKQTSEVTVLPKDKLQEAEMLISVIEDKTSKIAKASKKEARTIAIEVIGDVKMLQTLQPLPLELATRLKKAMDLIQISRTSKDDRLPFVLNNAKKVADEKLIQAIDILQKQTQDIDELKRISLMLTSDMEKQNMLQVREIRTQIQTKIQEQQKKSALEKIKNIPPNIARIIESVASGDIDIQVAIQTIEEEARSRVASKPQKRSFMAPTVEQEKRQIAMQITNAISENPDKYQFKNPETAIEQIQLICGAEKGQTLRAMVTNLIGRKHFETAKRICRKFSANNEDQIIAAYTRRLWSDIKNAEVANMVLDAIKMRGTPEEQGTYYDAIEMKIKKEEVNPSAVSLGENYDKTKQITLADIWLPEGKNKNGINR